VKQITSRDNPTVKQLHALATSARERRTCGETLLDGAHLLGVALERGWQPLRVVVSESGRRSPRSPRCWPAASDICIELPDRLFAHVSPVDRPAACWR
jgi:TrmH family RNA methyltransferase